MAQKSISESGQAVVCLFCGVRTFVPASRLREFRGESDSSTGVTLVRCQVCHKEAPYFRSEMIPVQEAAYSARSRAAGV
jgi:hypothetical protein